MDPELLRQRQQFLKRAASTPIVASAGGSKRPATGGDGGSGVKKPRSGLSRGHAAGSSSSIYENQDLFSYKTSSGSSNYKFAILHKILQYMKKRHLEGDTHGLTVDEILEETKHFDVNRATRSWLENEALRNNPKMKVTADNKFTFKPPYNISSRKELLRLLDKYDGKGFGGIIMDDVMESLPSADKHIKFLEEKDMIVIISRPVDKKKVLFYNDRSLSYTVDEEIKKLWRGVTLDGLDDDKIEDYLKKSGHSTVKSVRPKVMGDQPKRKDKKGKQFKKLNEHMQGILQDYSHL